jgi:hypothetical protein
MPRPVYLLCCQSSSIDQATNRISLFNVVEEIHVVLIKEQGKLPAPMIGSTLRVVSTWMREEGDDPEQPFHVEFAVKIPTPTGSPEEVVFSGAEVRFGAPFHRLVTADIGYAYFPCPGILWFECRIRKKEETDWIARQEFPILLTVVEGLPPSQGEPLTS